VALAGTLAITIAGCKSQEKKAEQARKSVRSWTAGMAMTCAQSQQHILPKQFVARALREAQDKLQKEAQLLPQSERMAAQRASADSSCSAADGGS
jgi:hypothetical protein